MKKIVVIILSCLHFFGAQAAINFGSRDSAIEVGTGGAFTINEAGTLLTNGTLRETGDGTGSIGGTFVATDMTIDTKADTTSSTVKTDGTVVVGTSITLGDNQRLVVNGGNVAETVSVEGIAADPSIIQGHGSFTADIAMAAPTVDRTLIMRWQGPLDQDIDIGAVSDTKTGLISLQHDLDFVSGKCIKGGGITTDGVNKVNFNGYRMSFSGATTTGTNDMTWDSANVSLNGALTVNTATITLATSAQINGHGNSITSASSGSLDGACTINDAKIIDPAVLGGSSTFTLNNVTIDDATNAVRIIDGSVTGGSADLYSAASTIGANTQMELLSNVTPGGQWTFGAGSAINGNGFKINAGSAGITSGSTLTLNDCYVDGVTAGTSMKGVNGSAWTLNNTTLDSSIGAMRVLEGTITENNAQFELDPFGKAVSWGASHIEVLRNTTFAASAGWTFTGNVDLIGNGKKISLANAGINASIYNFTLTDAHLTDLGTNMTGNNVWYINNSIFENSSNKIRIDGSFTEDNDANHIVNPFTHNMDWNAGTVSLLSNLAPAGTWKNGATGVIINGDGYTFDCGGSGKRFELAETMTLNNITLYDVVAATIDKAADANLSLNNVKWYDASVGAVHIHGGYATQGPAVVTLTTNTSAGSFFGSATLSTTFSSAGVKMSLLDHSTLGGKWVIGGNSLIDGNGFALDCRSDNAIFDMNAELTLANLTLNEVHADTFDTDSGTRILHLNNVDWVGTDTTGGTVVGGLRISGGRTGSTSTNDITPAKLTLADSATAGDIFSDSVTWGATNKGVALELTANTTISGSSTWTFAGDSSINGNGHVLNLLTGTIDFNDHLHLNNVVLADVAAGSFASAADKNLYLTNVTWVDDTTEGAMTIKASTEVGLIRAALVNLAETNSGNIYNSDVYFVNGANIELDKNITFGSSATWNFSDHSIINGNGNVIDLSNAANPIDIANGKSLIINNAVIKGWDNSHDITFAGGELKLSNVTIIMGGDITLDATEDLTVNGPLTIVTGEHIFTAHASATNTVNNITVWYDTLGTVDNSNVSISNLTGGGQVKIVGSGGAGSGATSFSTSNTYVDDSLFLDYDINNGSLQAAGTQITLNNATAFTLLGGGRTMKLGNTATHSTGYLVNVSGTGDDGIVKIHDLVFDGWAQAHIQDNSKLKYGNGSVIKLDSNQALTTTIYLGDTADSESVVLDLGGHDLDMSNASALLNIAKATTTGGTFTIKNGRIINLSGSKILAEGSDTKAETIFEDVDLVLSGATTLSASKFTFKGNCSLGGTTAATLTCEHTPLKVEDGATLTIQNGMTLELAGDGVNSTDPTITLDSDNSTIFFDGGNLTLTDITDSAITITTGTIKVDNIATFNLGSGQTLNLGATGGNATTEIDLDMQPASSIKVTSGTLAYLNDT